MKMVKYISASTASSDIKTHTEFKQGTGEWLKMKLGKISASSFHKILGTKKAREDYLWEVASERITSSPSDTKEHTNLYLPYHMQRGINYEDEARQAYSFANNFIDVDQVGLIELNDYVVCSPDGLIGENGMIEIKILDSNNYAKNVVKIDKAIKKDKKGIVAATQKEYYIQIQFNLYISNRQWCDYILYNPKHAPLGTGLFYRRIERDMQISETIRIAVEESVKMIDQYIIDYKEAFQQNEGI